MVPPLCAVCSRHLTNQPASVERPWQCALCFGILDPDFIAEVAEKAAESLNSECFDSHSFVLALNVPVSVTLREAIIECSNDSEMRQGTLSSVPFKLRLVDAYTGKLKEATGLHPSLGSDLKLTLTLVNDEFNLTDSVFLFKHFKEDFVPSRKRKRFEPQQPLETNFTKVRVSNIVSKITPEISSAYEMISPSKKCTFSFAFERKPIFIAGRYCKFSRSLPQSPWTASEELPKVNGNSVSEKITKVLSEETRCDSTRFIASGREDIDVRMLGSGRPFVVECFNPRRRLQFLRDLLKETLCRLEKSINDDKDIKLGSSLKLIAEKQASDVKLDQEDKQKCYTAYCYCTEEILEANLDKLSTLAPIEILQKTPVRVLKRRSLLERKRNVFSMDALKVDDLHFLLRLETQAGTYVKEFIHGDFGRTKPSLRDLLGLTTGEVDIIELDVEYVNMEWPPG
ncbi:unnamed protein product [Enterobius vermicularis]|uniref:tRNA pseudouridine(55) synthase n=1 Tax=Enterobius vermicularis TaxID=51028 RepID=A0A0N4UUJ1_ENTVE|nr:unnamed protein product [Enterobius vermicularis]